MVGKIFEKLVTNRLVDHIKECRLFSDFRCSRFSAGLLTIPSDRIARAFNRSVATRVVALDILKAYGRV